MMPMNDDPNIVQSEISQKTLSKAPQKDSTEKAQGVFLNILINILLPVIILDKLSTRLGSEGPLIALIIALSLPLGYGLYDFFKLKKRNFISVLGFLNILFTGGLVVLGLQGIWFAVKEAAFPSFIGVFIFISAYTKKPFIQVLIFNPVVMNLDLIQEKIKEKNSTEDFKEHLKFSTFFLSASFFLSAVLNYYLARKIFIDIDLSLEQQAREIILNKQIADMQWQSIIVIMLPSFIAMIFILWHLFSGIKKFTGLSLNQFLNESPTKKTLDQKK